MHFRANTPTVQVFILEWVVTFQSESKKSIKLSQSYRIFRHLTFLLSLLLQQMSLFLSHWHLSPCCTPMGVFCLGLQQTASASQQTYSRCSFVEKVKSIYSHLIFAQQSYKGICGKVASVKHMIIKHTNNGMSRNKYLCLY